MILSLGCSAKISRPVPYLAYGLGTEVHIPKLSTLGVKCWASHVGYQSLFQTEAVLAAGHR